MHLQPSRAFAFGFAILSGGLAAAGAASAEEASQKPVATSRTSDRCAQFGPGFVDVGQGVCARVTGHVTTHIRVWVGRREAGIDPLAPALGLPLPGSNPWPRPAASAATLRSGGLASEDMVPGGTVTHLRVRGSLDGPNYP